MPKVSRSSKHRVSTPLTITDLPSMLVSWSQAVRNFHTLHGVLSETIASHQSANGAKPVTQYSLCELKKVRDTVAQEIFGLINELDNSGDLSPESASLTIGRLRSHTIRLEKEAEGIKRALWLSSLGAS